jgi:hypothetical protein
MNVRHSPSSDQICEAFLLEEKRYNTENHIWPSQNAIIDRLLERRVEMLDVYSELLKKLPKREIALESVLGLVLSTAAIWSPQKIAKVRDQRAELSEINQIIATKAAELADLLEKRDVLQNLGGFYSDTHYSICKVIEDASERNHLYQFYVHDKLSQLYGQYDLKYWPSLAKCVKEVAADADTAIVEAVDSITAAATSSSRHSLADFVRALFAAIEENVQAIHSGFPEGFKLTDSAIATITNCALDMGADELVDASYIKGIRQRQRRQI